MKPSADLPHLKIISIDRLHPHELPDEQRAQPLVSALRRDRVLKNPPIVQQLDGHQEYVVLDGANRVTALRILGSPHCLVQIAQPAREQIEVKTWNHVLLGLDAVEVRQLVANASSFNSAVDEQAQAIPFEDPKLQVVFVDGEKMTIALGRSDLRQRIARLKQFVEAYQTTTRFERTSEIVLDGLNGLYESVAAIVLFPPFKAEDVVRAAAAGWHFPPGITRFIVSPRALRLNYPLAMFDGKERLAEKEKNLETWIQSRVRNRRVRFYAESTFMFDE